MIHKACRLNMLIRQAFFKIWPAFIPAHRFFIGRARLQGWAPPFLAFGSNYSSQLTAYGGG